MKNGLVVDDRGTMRWYKDDLLHRDDDLPVVIRYNGTKFWFQNGNCHRENGPAIMYATGGQYWWLNDKMFTFDDWCIRANKSPKEKAYLLLKYFN